MVPENDVEITYLAGEIDQRAEGLPRVRIRPRYAQVGDGDDDLRAGALGLRTSFVSSHVGLGDFDGAEAAGKDQRGSLGVGDADDRNFYAADLKYLEGLHACQVAFEVLQIGRDVLKLSQINHGLQVGSPPVEVVIAECIYIEPHQVHGLHGRRFIEKAGERWRSAKGVACGEGQGVGIGRPVGSPESRDLGGTSNVANPENEEGIELSVPVGNR